MCRLILYSMLIKPLAVLCENKEDVDKFTDFKIQEAKPDAPIELAKAEPVKEAEVTVAETKTR
jgi:hypothetical protein